MTRKVLRLMKLREGVMTEPEIIVKMREALDLLKEKLQEAEGAWITVDFLGAALDKSHWMHKIVEAEKLSQPYMPKAEA
jgi:hypothetical protein